MINYDAVFFSQGVVDTLYWKQMMKTRKGIAETMFAPIAIVGAILFYSITSPMVYSDMGHLFFYPLYRSYPLQCLYTCGTWLWVFSVIWMMHLVGNKQFNKTTYNLICGSSLYAYVSHYFFILIISVMIVRPYKIGFIPAFFLMLFGTEFLIFATYIPLNFLYELCVPPKETKAAASDEEIKAEAALQEAEQKAAAKAAAIEGGKGAIDLEAESGADQQIDDKSSIHFPDEENNNE